MQVDKATRAYHDAHLQDDQQSAASEAGSSMASNLESDDEEVGDEIHCTLSFAGTSGGSRPPNTNGLSKISKTMVDIRRLDEEKAEASRRLGRAVWTAGRDPQAIGPSDHLVRLVVDALHRDVRQSDARHGISYAFKAVDNAHDAREDAFRRLGDAALAIMPANSTPEGTGPSGLGRAPNSRR